MVSNGKVTLNDGLETMLKESVVACFKGITWEKGLWEAIKKCQESWSLSKDSNTEPPKYQDRLLFTTSWYCPKFQPFCQQQYLLSNANDNIYSKTSLQQRQAQYILVYFLHTKKYIFFQITVFLQLNRKGIKQYPGLSLYAPYAELKMKHFLVHNTS
jgi:hypothetical protein